MMASGLSIHFLSTLPSPLHHYRMDFPDILSIIKLRLSHPRPPCPEVAADPLIIEGNPFLQYFRGRFPQRIGFSPVPSPERILCIVLNPAAAACCFVLLDVHPTV